MANRHGFERHLRPTDLLLVPPLLDHMSVMDWGRHRELYQATHAWALTEVDRLRASGHAALRIDAGPSPRTG
jgi:hypothetical protein